jgi:predicted heme/steroid binding protein
MREFTLQELSQYHGEQGRPAYIACHGKVYDVTPSFLWKNGRHQVLIHAGKDLTDELTDAPHGLDLLEKFQVIGILVNSSHR